MSYNDDNNPFADPAIRQATASSLANHQISSEYNPFTNITTPVRHDAPQQYPYVAPASAPPQHPNVAAVLPPAQPPTYQSSYYTTPVTPTPAQQSTEKYGNDAKQASTRIDLSQYERQQAELAEREKRLTERERTLTDPTKIQKREKNFPPLPKICPCGPCFYQDINIEIPSQFQTWVRYLYYVWLAYAVTLFLNMIAALSYFVVDKDGAASFGLSLVYLFLFIPSSYVCWFRPIYRAFSGFVLMIKLFSAGGSKIIVGLIVMIVTSCFAMLAIVDSLLMIKVHRLYRLSGGSIEQAQQEFQSAFVNNPTVRGAARDVATAGINDALRPNDNQQRPIY